MAGCGRRRRIRLPRPLYRSGVVSNRREIGVTQHSRQIRRCCFNSLDLQGRQCMDEAFARTFTGGRPSLHLAKHRVIVTADGIAALDAEITSDPRAPWAGATA